MKAYNSNLCWRMIYQVKVQNLIHHEVANNLCVDQSTVSCTVALLMTLEMSQRGNIPPTLELQSSWIMIS